MKIAVMTFYKENNYGTVLQAAALCRYLSGLGHKADLIRYASDGQVQTVYIGSARSEFMIHVREELREEQNPSVAGRISGSGFERFRERNFTETFECVTLSDLERLNEQYDVFLCGSERIWFATSFDSHLFLDFVHDPQRMIAYAPCILREGMEDLHVRKRMGELIGRFSHLSVREEIGRKLLDEYFQIQTEEVADPVLLLTADEWNAWLEEEARQKAGEETEEAGQEEQEEPYLLLYFLSGKNAYWDAAYKLAQRQGLQVRAIPVYESNLNRPAVLTDEVDPARFAELVKNASYVCTDSYHMVLLSILFHKEMCCFNRYPIGDMSGRNIRIRQILDAVGILNRLYDDNTPLEQYLSQTDFIPVEYKLNALRIKSEAFLADALGEIERRDVNEKPGTLHVREAYRLCCGCGACQAVCPEDAVHVSMQPSGFYEAVVEEEKCVRCGKCTEVCPMRERADGRLLSDGQLLSYTDERPDVCADSDAGGFARRLSGLCSDKGYIIAGCAFDEDLRGAKHILVPPEGCILPEEPEVPQECAVCEEQKPGVGEGEVCKSGQQPEEAEDEAEAGPENPEETRPGETSEVYEAYNAEREPRIYEGLADAEEPEGDEEPEIPEEMNESEETETSEAGGEPENPEEPEMSGEPEISEGTGGGEEAEALEAGEGPEFAEETDGGEEAETAQEPETAGEAETALKPEAAGEADTALEPEAGKEAKDPEEAEAFEETGTLGESEEAETAQEPEEDEETGTARKTDEGEEAETVQEPEAGEGPELSEETDEGEEAENLQEPETGREAETAEEINEDEGPETAREPGEGGETDIPEEGEEPEAGEEVSEREQLLNALQGIKLSQSDFSAVWKLMKEEEYPALIIGAPCQIAAARKVFEGKDNFVYIDFVCGGVPTKLLIEKYRHTFRGRNGISQERFRIRFRYKNQDKGNQYILITDDSREKVIPMRKDALGRMMNMGSCCSEACFNCRWRDRSCADLRIGTADGSGTGEKQLGVIGISMRKDEVPTLSAGCFGNKKEDVTALFCMTPKGKELLDLLMTEGYWEGLHRQQKEAYLDRLRMVNYPVPVYYPELMEMLRDENIHLKKILNEYAKPVEKRERILHRLQRFSRLGRKRAKQIRRKRMETQNGQ